MNYSERRAVLLSQYLPQALTSLVGADAAVEGDHDELRALLGTLAWLTLEALETNHDYARREQGSKRNTSLVQWEHYVDEDSERGRRLFWTYAQAKVNSHRDEKFLTQNEMSRIVLYECPDVNEWGVQTEYFTDLGALVEGI